MKAQPIVPASSEIDQQIIAALLDTETDLLHDLYGRGLTQQAVSVRAGELGLTREIIKRCRLAGTTPAMRSCVKCDAKFLSAGKHNRLCGRCPAR